MARAAGHDGRCGGAGPGRRRWGRGPHDRAPRRPLTPPPRHTDFSHAPGNLTNLALKCVLAMGAQAYQEQAAGNASGAAALYAAARTWGEGFVQHGWTTAGGPHFQFI